MVNNIKYLEVLYIPPISDNRRCERVNLILGVPHFLLIERELLLLI